MHIMQMRAKYQIRRGKAKVWSYSSVFTFTSLNTRRRRKFLSMNIWATSRLPRCQRCRWVYSFIIALPRPRSTMEISILIGSDIV